MFAWGSPTDPHQTLYIWNHMNKHHLDIPGCFFRIDSYLKIQFTKKWSPSVYQPLKRLTFDHPSHWSQVSIDLQRIIRSFPQTPKSPNAATLQRALNATLLSRALGCSRRHTPGLVPCGATKKDVFTLRMLESLGYWWCDWCLINGYDSGFDCDLSITSGYHSGFDCELTN